MSTLNQQMNRALDHVAGAAMFGQLTDDVFDRPKVDVMGTSPEQVAAVTAHFDSLVDLLAGLTALSAHTVEMWAADTGQPPQELLKRLRDQFHDDT